jgi:putative flavoprotein involved in K+ transport
MANNEYDVIIIGGGQSGLVAGYYLNSHNLTYIVLDANPDPGGSWQHYYKNLKLFSPAKYGQLPGLPFPGDPSREPTRYEVIDYLREYERLHQIPVERGVRVEAVHKPDDRFTLVTADGLSYRAKAVIAASGPFNTPYTPHLPGADHFQGRTLHAFDYHEPEPYRRQHVVVVGSRDSAMQIAYELSQVARVSVAARRPLEFMPKSVLGKSIFWWLHDTGYDELPLGLFTRLHGSKKIVGKQPYQTALNNGNPTVKPMFTHFTADGVVWGDGTPEPVDTVIYATGYKTGMTYLAPLPAREDDGYPIQTNGVSDVVDGLFFVGLFGQRSHASATLRGVGRDAKHIANRAAQHVRQQTEQAAFAPAD